MTDDLYERYKEALRLGHVAVLRGALEEAIDAYRNAASIAPSRALPHTSVGGVLLRLGHLEEALVEYAAAVARAPHDEGALLGQAEALTIAGQRVDAAQALDHVSEVQEAAGRLPEAADTLRRALELEEAPERTRRQRSLLREIRLSAGDQAAEQLLARALRLRDEPSAPEPARSGYGPAPLQGRMAAAAAAAAGSAASTPAAAFQPIVVEAMKPAQTSRPDLGFERLPTPVEAAPPEPPPAAVKASEGAAPTGLAEPAEPAVQTDEPAAASVVAPAEVGWPAADVARALQSAEPVESQAVDTVVAAQAPEPEPVVAEAAAALETPEPAPEPSPETPEPILAAVGVMEGALDTAAVAGLVGESEHQPTGDELLAAAEAADLAGDNTALRSLLLWTARAYAREGLFEAGLDATHRLLQRAPGDVDAHLVLVELYVARDWNGLAAEKLALLGRLAELNNDDETRQRLCAVASRVFPNDERLEALCS